MDIQNLFPVYDMLLDQVRTIPNYDGILSTENMVELKTKINMLDKLGRDMIYVIIRIHSIRYSESKLLDIPFDGKKLDSKNENNEILIDVKFDIRNFPAVLSRILIKFCDLHLRKIREDTDKTNKFKVNYD